MNFFKNSSLKAKLIILTLSLSCFTVLSGGIATYYLKTAVSDYQDIIDQPAAKLDLNKDMLTFYRDLRVNLTILAVPDLNKPDSERALKFIDSSIKEYEGYHKKYVDLEFDPGQKELYEATYEEWNKYKTLSAEIITLYKTGTAVDKAKLAELVLNKADDISNAYTQKYEKIAKYHELQMVNEAKAVHKKSTQGQFITLGVVIASFIIALIIGIMFSNFINNSLRSIVKDLQESGDHVSLTSSQIASKSEQLSQATAEQAASLQETSSSIEQISSMISANTENAKNSAQISGTSLSAAEKGKKVVQNMIQAMEDISTSNNGIMNQVDFTNKEIEGIVSIINEINTKTKVINDIVFQTKLLSFNASVEAARAGEQGKGFAVVAEEVGSLAAMSGAAALEISKLLETSTKKVQDIVALSKSQNSKLIVEAKDKVSLGTKVSHECEAVLNEIVQSVSSVSKMATEISSASEEQSQGVHEITKAVAQLDQITQQNATNSAESANAAGSLFKQAETLKSIVDRMVYTIQGSNSNTAAYKEEVKKVVKSLAVKDVKKDKTVSYKETIKNKPVAVKVKEVKKVESKPIHIVAPTKAIRNDLPTNDDPRFEDV